jgi:chloramphenicol 3-O-phosphotransferase
MNIQFRAEPPGFDAARLPAIVVISGMQGAGKTTVARRLATRLPNCAHIEADELTKLIVSGRRWPEAREMSAEASLQLRLRLQQGCLLARSFLETGFSAVFDDIIMGARLDELLLDMTGQAFYFVMLTPSLEAVIERERGRGSRQYEAWGWMDDEVRNHTRRIGLWLDTTAQSVEETVDEVLARVWTEGLVAA